MSSGLAIVLSVIIALFVGMIIGWIVATLYFRKQIKENPVISEAQIRELYRQAGRRLSEKQVSQIMNSLKKQN